MEKKHQRIKEDMVERAMELWGIEDLKLIDPVIELLLDVFSYEFSKIEQDIKISDAKLLERISKILVQESWSLPLPAHALLSAIPTEDIHEINRNTPFFVQKLVQGDQRTDLFFTPLLTHQLIHARIACTVKHTNAYFFDERGHNTLTIDIKGDKRIKDYTLWVGIDIDHELLQEISEIPLALILRNSQIDSYLKLLTFYDSQNTVLEHRPSYEGVNATKEHYFDPVIRYYQNYLHTLTLPKEKSKQSLLEKFNAYFFEEDIEINQDFFWIKIEFPVAFTQLELDKLEVKMNTFPIVNRKLQYAQHNIKRNGKIASLRTLNEYFLNIEKLFDNEARIYNTTLHNDIHNLKGTYSLYFGELEQFDERNAKAVLDQVIQKVREEGSSFSAIGYDLLNAYLEDLNEKLNSIERKVNIGYSNISKNNRRQYLLTIPYEDSHHLECQFWTTDADDANHIPTGKVVGQFQTNELIPQSIRLQTDTVGGDYKDDVKEKISNLRYGLLSKDRIVSVEDIKEFVRKNIGKTVKRIEVNSGVGISPNKKAGLIRTTQIEVYLTHDYLHNNENKKRLSNSLQLELEQRSVHNLPYSVVIH